MKAVELMRSQEIMLKSRLHSKSPCPRSVVTLTGGEKRNEPGRGTTKDDSARYAVVNRQVKAWEKRDLPSLRRLVRTESFSPEVHVVKKTCRARSLTISISLI